MENVPLVDFTLISTNGNNEVWESENFIFFFLKMFLGFLRASLGNPFNILCFCKLEILFKKLRQHILNWSTVHFNDYKMTPWKKYNGK